MTPKAEQDFDAQAGAYLWGGAVVILALVALLMALAAEYGCA